MKQNPNKMLKWEEEENEEIERIKERHKSKAAVDIRNRIKGGLNGKNLHDEWGLFNIPLIALRDCYGERVALYFNFLNYYTWYLLVIGCFGVPIFIIEMYFEEGSIPDRAV